MDATQYLGALAIFGVVTVVYGGWALLTFVTGREGMTEEQKRFFRAGHAHAGVLLVLALVSFQYFDEADLSEGMAWTIGGVLLVGQLAQSGGFFVHMGAAGGSTASGSIGTRITRVGALLIGASLLALAIALVTA